MFQQKTKKWIVVVSVLFVIFAALPIMFLNKTSVKAAGLEDLTVEQNKRDALQQASISPTSVNSESKIFPTY